MKKIVRLTESDLSRIIKRVVNESADEQKKQLIKQNITECFDEKKYPNLAKRGSADNIITLTSIFLGIGPIAVSVMSITEAEKKELNELIKCLLN